MNGQNTHATNAERLARIETQDYVARIS